MKLAVYNQQNQKTGEKELPVQFQEEYRPDLIKRAVLVLRANRRQAYGAKPGAGMRHSAELSRRRRKYRGGYGFGISRITRKILSRRGTRFNWVGALAPHTTGGRRAHAPKAEKIWEQKINKKENRKAIRSALSAVLDKLLVKKRGHQVPENYPFILDSEIEKLDKTKDVKKLLAELGFAKELQRSAVKKVRAGMGKLRGRKYQRKKGILIVVSDACPLLKSAANIPGVDAAKVDGLNAELLAPGCQAGRITLLTENAINVMEKKGLFM